MKNNTRKTLKIYWSHIIKYKLSGLIILFSIVAGSAINVILPIYYKKFFDILGTEQTKEIIAGRLIDVLITILIINFIGWITWRTADFYLPRFYTKLIADIQNTCFRYLHKHSFSYFNNNFVGSLVKRVAYFANSFRDILDRTLWEFIPMIIKISIIVVVLFWSNFVLGAILVIWLIIILIINWFMAQYKMKFDIKKAEAQTQATGFLSDTITNNSNVKLFCGYKKEVKGFFKINEKVRKLTAYSFNLDNIFEAVQALFMVGLEIGIFYVGIKLWKKDMFTLGDFVLLQSYVLIVVNHIWVFGKMIRKTYQNLADAEEMTEILNTPHEIQDVRRAKTLEVKKGKIELKNVDKSYHENNRDLTNIDLDQEKARAAVLKNQLKKNTLLCQ